MWLCSHLGTIHSRSFDWNMPAFFLAVCKLCQMTATHLFCLYCWPCHFPGLLGCGCAGASSSHKMVSLCHAGVTQATLGTFTLAFLMAGIKQPAMSGLSFACLNVSFINCSIILLAVLSGQGTQPGHVDGMIEFLGQSSGRSVGVEVALAVECPSLRRVPSCLSWCALHL